MDSTELAAHARQLLNEASEQRDFDSDAERYYLSAAQVYATLSTAAMRELLDFQRHLFPGALAAVAVEATPSGGEPQ